jgi:hypothetical protein
LAPTCRVDPLAAEDEFFCGCTEVGAAGAEVVVVSAESVVDVVADVIVLVVEAAVVVVGADAVVLDCGAAFVDVADVVLDVVPGLALAAIACSRSGTVMIATIRARRARRRVKGIS